MSSTWPIRPNPCARKVAMKIIKPGMDSKEVVARFEAERQALALMDHPNMARVLDAGTTDSGRPYFVMELVRGLSITEYCDDNELDTRARLELFNQVCRAIQHAHQKGVIHRDLKPSNVMVTLHDGKPVPKVIDFGVAKALSQQLTEKTLFTRYGQIVGTPLYMSPEQAEMSGLDIDIRSDIYSLGVLLYELLTGKTPLDADELRKAGFDAMRQMIRESEPPKPSTRLRTLDDATATAIASHRATQPIALCKSMSGDLDWIVMKALDKDRNRRYESANSLAGDIERYLRCEPVEAAPPTLTYQLSKLYRRNRVAVTTVAAIGAAIVIGLCLTSWAWYAARAQKLVALAAQARAEELRVQATENASEARKQADAATREATRAKASLEVLQALLAQTSPGLESGTDVTVSEFLNTFAARLDAEPLKDKEVEIDVRMALASALGSFSQSTEAIEQLAVVEDIGRPLYSSNGPQFLPFLIDVATKLETVGADQRAEALLLEALPLARLDEADKTWEVEVLTKLGAITILRRDDIRNVSPKRMRNDRPNDRAATRRPASQSVPGARRNLGVPR